MSNFLIDPLISADHLRQEIYNGGHHPAQGLVPLPSVGQVLLFSGAQLHRSNPNAPGLARYGVYFRTFGTRGLMANRNTPLMDAHGNTVIRDFIRVTDESIFAEEAVTAPSGAGGGRNASVRGILRRWVRPCLSVRILLSQVSGVRSGKILLQDRIN